MKLRTEIERTRSAISIGLSTRMVAVGSCFTDEVGNRLYDCNFDISVNPFGTLYNPLSMARAINDAIDMRRFTADDIFFHEGRWHTFERHSSHSDADPERMLARLNDSIGEVNGRLREADVLIATMGSAVAFVDRESGRVVANCHKQPADRFERRVITVQETTDAWLALMRRLRNLNPGLKLILTVSPVRHIGYGLVADRLSKSTLIVAEAAIVKALRSEGVEAEYFPAYEAIVDDLRDYRFYADDMVHPSATAVDYVFDLFRETHMDGATIDASRRWDKLARQAQHRYSSPEARAEAMERIEEQAAVIAAGERSLAERFHISHCIVHN